MIDPPSGPEDRHRGVAPRSAAARRPRRGRLVRIIAIVLLLLFVLAQVSGGTGHGSGGRTASSAPGKSHLDEARGHLNAIAHLFD